MTHSSEGREAVTVRVVPVEPTDKMTAVGQRHRYDSAWSIGAIYREMIAAAPSPTEAPAEAVREAQARFISEHLLRMDYDGIRPDSIRPRGFKPVGFSSWGGVRFQGGQADLLEIVDALNAMAAPAPAAGGLREALALAISLLEDAMKHTNWECDGPNPEGTTVARLRAALTPPAENAIDVLALRFTNEWLKDKIGSDGDVPVEVGAPAESALPQDVINLVIAAREVIPDPSEEGLDALDKALEAFSERVRYENEPDEAELTESAPSGEAVAVVAYRYRWLSEPVPLWRLSEKDPRPFPYDDVELEGPVPASALEALQREKEEINDLLNANYDTAIEAMERRGMRIAELEARIAALEASLANAAETERDRLYEHAVQNGFTAYTIGFLGNQGAMLPADRATARAARGGQANG